MSSLVYVGLDRQLFLTDVPSGATLQLTTGGFRGSGAWNLLRSGQDAWAWPTWSPRGDWLGAFATESGDQTAGPTRVVTLSLDGIRQEEWAEIQNAAPIYLQWHPSGNALTVLMQQDQELALALLRRDRLGQVRPLEQGVPLFFNWTPEGDRVLIHVGSREGDGRLVLRDPMGDNEDVLYDQVPGSFCAPVFVGGKVAFAAEIEGERGSELILSAPDGSDARPILRRKGLMAIVGGPSGLEQIAVAHAPRGEGTPYQGIDLVDVHSGAVTRVTDAELLAFFWSPTGAYLLYAQVDADANCLTWFRVAATGGDPVRLGTFWPTRDMLFFLHFFDQYAGSHSLLSADGRYCVYAGYPAGGGQADLSAPPRIYVKDVEDPGAEAVEVGRGTFAVFSPVA